MLRICTAIVLAFMPVSGIADIMGVVHVIDADTIDVGEIRIRLHAIDAPEQDQNCTTEHGVAFACGAWATDQVVARFAGQYAKCSATDIDKYGRTVATCDVGGVDMGREIVSLGWAFAYRRYGMDYDLDEVTADAADRGLHGFHVQSPAQFRATRVKGRIPLDPNCRIKGNISKHGQIFHVPGQEFYERTGINLSRGERWFCSNTEARAAGWRAARR
ncbi:MAG: thermonuclease family protein [Tateyamaria sp.]|uniref:thermonuclease family protein n=2 Tax=Tateyamaria sp. TaxID=1929288 RepID=UPI00329C3F52